jgi:hypothetical protein
MYVCAFYVVDVYIPEKTNTTIFMYINIYSIFVKIGECKRFDLLFLKIY